MPAEDAEELLGAVEDEYGGEHAAQAEQGNIPETLVIQGPFDSFDHIRPPWLLPGRRPTPLATTSCGSGADRTQQNLEVEEDLIMVIDSK
ncbi:MAG: hypothetical protein R3E53_00295 [Myxococcota bacterium]